MDLDGLFEQNVFSESGASWVCFASPLRFRWSAMKQKQDSDVMLDFNRGSFAQTVV